MQVQSAKRYREDAMRIKGEKVKEVFIGHTRRLNAKKIEIVPRDVVEDLEIVERSIGFRSWTIIDKKRLRIAMTQLGNCTKVEHTVGRLIQSIGRLKKLHGKLPRNQRTIERSIERLEELL